MLKIRKRNQFFFLVIYFLMSMESLVVRKLRLEPVYDQQ